jgi:DNA-binding transcriptional LysR family regulator
VLLPALSVRLRTRAPGIALAMISPSESGSSSMLNEGKADIALAGPSAELHDTLKQQKLFDEDFVCVARRKHPALKKGLTLDAYCHADHILASPRGGGFRSPLDDALATIGRTRNVRMSIAQFLLGPRLVAQSNLLMTIGKRLAQSLAKELDLAVYSLPFKAPSFRIVQAWHVRLDRDPLQKWLRLQIYESAKELSDVI